MEAGMADRNKKKNDGNDAARRGRSDDRTQQNQDDFDQVSENRNLTGSTTWETLPDTNPSGERAD
jgi:hypothetical protein